MEGEEREGAWLYLLSLYCERKMPGHLSREEGASFLPAGATYSRCLPFPFPASLLLKTKLPLRLEIN